MSQYGYGYGPPQGYPPPLPPPPPPLHHVPPPQAPPAYPYQPPPPQYQFPPPYHPQEQPPPNQYHYDHGMASQSAYDYNHGSIPGLGLNGPVPNDVPHWQQNWNSIPPPPPSLPQPVASGEIRTPGVGMMDHFSPQRNHPPPPPRRNGDDVMEEGELSEGELQDIYPRPISVDDRFRPNPNPYSRHFSGRETPYDQRPRHDSRPRAHEREGQRSTDGHWGPSRLPRERSRSYSPFLSPREVNSTSRSSSGQAAMERDRNNKQDVSMEPQNTNEREKSTQPTADAISPRDAAFFSEQKKAAQDAILRLWPLNIRYQHYLDQGISKTIVDGLFEELGLDTAAGTHDSEKAAQEPSAEAEAEAVADREVPTATAGEATITTATAETMPSSGDQPGDKTEERKDRIARLLAAKGSKTAAAKPAPAAAAVKSAATRQAKSLSEKSRLLQQRIEALNKSREPSSKQPSEQQDSLAVPVAADTNASSAESTAVASAAISPSIERPDLDTPLEPQPDAPETVDAQADGHIPGLHLSTTPQRSPRISQRKRPAAADLNDSSTTGVSKRPFGQARESRPFLIDVSDDEDDAEMEIDSPELRSSVIHRPITPAFKAASFREHPPLSHLPSRQLSSPSAMGTPTGRSGSANGIYDLESMNRKIEDMKRKIAEAELKKKQKQPSNGFSVPPSQEQSKENSAELPSGLRPPFPLARTYSDDNASSTSLANDTLRLPKIRGSGKQAVPAERFRIASARLSVVQTHRKDKEARLEQLRLELAQVQKEIEDDKAEEDQLLQDVEMGNVEDVSSSDATGENSTQNSTPDEHSEQAFERPVEESQSTVEEPHPVNELSEVLPTVPSDSENVQEDTQPAADIDSTRDGKAIFEHTNDSVISSSEDSTLATMTAHVANEDPAAEHLALPVPPEPPVDVEPVKPVQSELPDPPEDDSKSHHSADEDVVMEEDSDSGEDQAVEDNDDAHDADVSVDYEPAVVTAEPSSYNSAENSRLPSPVPTAEGAILETSDADVPGVVSLSTPITNKISMADEGSTSEADREAKPATKKPELRTSSSTPGSTFVPYQTPLQYFHAYRFHPKFQEDVSGGLRSLTYSNKIDTQKEVCPDELVTGVCPRGSACEFQHFESIRVPDDQILLQLGAYGNFEEEQKQKYIAGLRELLTDFRNRKVRDFQTISQGILDYRAQFHDGDKSKILPLGSVNI